MVERDQYKMAEEIRQAYRDVFLHSPAGERVLADIIKAAGLYTISGVRDDSELQHMEGGRDMVRRIISIIALDEGKLQQLAKGD